MSAVAWTHWDEAFLAADKESERRLTFTLSPPMFERALVSLASEHGWLPKSDSRYQEACRTGRLEWWDGRGRCVVVVREGASVPFAGVATPEFLRAPDPYAGEPLVPDPVVEGGFLPKSIADEVRRQQSEAKAIVAELSKPPDGLVPTSSPDAVGAPMPPKGKGKKK